MNNRKKERKIQREGGRGGEREGDRDRKTETPTERQKSSRESETYLHTYIHTKTETHIRDKIHSASIKTGGFRHEDRTRLCMTHVFAKVKYGSAHSDIDSKIMLV